LSKYGFRNTDRFTVWVQLAGCNSENGDTILPLVGLAPHAVLRVFGEARRQLLDNTLEHYLRLSHAEGLPVCWQSNVIASPAVEDRMGTPLFAGTFAVISTGHAFSRIFEDDVGSSRCWESESGAVYSDTGNWSLGCEDVRSQQEHIRI
jgi:hypothetical protein